MDDLLLTRLYNDKKILESLIKGCQKFLVLAVKF